MENQIEESLENLDNLLNNIRSKEPGKREEEIKRIGQKYNLEFNLNQEDQDGGNGNYGKAQKVFEYKQPFTVQQPQTQIPSDQSKNIVHQIDDVVMSNH